MSILNRLKRLAANLINDSGFCDCNGQEQQIEIRQIPIKYDAYATGKYVPYQDSDTAKEIDRESETETLTFENCERCGNAINKRVIILSLVGS
ncbi:MAG: hypothetical protein ACR2N3_11045 [Pyrinomonadaceae bacterium]